MPTCPSCKKEIAEGAVICKHCGAKLGTPDRPKGVTVIAVLSFIGALFTFFALFSLNNYNSIILGINVPVTLAQLHAVVMACISVYCGVGFLKLKETARKVYIYYGSYSLLASILGMIRLPSILDNMPELRYMSSSIRQTAIVSGVIGAIVGMALVGYILYYLARRKDYFVN